MGSCISSGAYTTAETSRSTALVTVSVLKQVAMLAIAAKNGQQLIDNFKKQNDLKSRAQSIAESIVGQLSAVFWPAEHQFRDEFSNPEPVEAIEVMGRRYAGRLVAGVAGGFAMKIHEAKCSMPRHCTSANMKTLQDLYLMRSFAVGTARTLGRNIAHAEWQARNDVNHERRKQAAALGRKLVGQASGLMAAAGQGLAAAGQGYADAFGSAIEAAGRARYRADENSLNKIPEYTDAPDEQYHSNNGAQMYGPGSAASDPYGGGYQYDSGADLYGSNESQYQFDTGQELYGDMRNSFETPERPNTTDVGAQDLVRTGKYKFEVQGGKGGIVEVDMAKFEVGIADHMEPNTGAPTGLATSPGGDTWPN